MGIAQVCCGGACACVRMPVCMRAYVAVVVRVLWWCVCVRA